MAALELLENTSGPVLDVYPQSIEDQAAQPLSCPVPPRHNPELPAAVDEARALRPAFSRAGGAGVKLADPRLVEPALMAFSRLAEGAPWKQAGLPKDILGAARAILGYYEQAAIGLADHVPAARQAESWYVHHTAAGATMRAARDQLREQGAPQPLWFYLLPATQR